MLSPGFVLSAQCVFICIYHKVISTSHVLLVLLADIADPAETVWPDAVDVSYHHWQLYPACLSSGLYTGQFAAANVQCFDDTCAAAILDVAIGANVRLEGDVAATGRDQRCAGMAGAGSR